MKKLISLLLAMVLTLSLAACSSGPELLGTYETDVDLTDLVVTEFDNGLGMSGVTLANYLDDFTITVCFEFKEDGTYSQSIDTASFDSAIANMKASMVPLMDDLLLASFSEQFSAVGITVKTKEDVESLVGITWDEIFPSTMGMSSEDFIDTMLSELSMEMITADFLIEGKYKAENSKLHVSLSLDEDYSEDAYETYEIDGDTVTITGGVNIEEEELIPYPYTLIKISE